MMGVTSLEVYNIVYIILAIDNELQILLTKERNDEFGTDT